MSNRSKILKSSEMPSGNLHDIVIPVMGPTGVGKSTFINTVLGQDTMAVGYDFESCTVDISTAEVDISKLRDFPCLKNRRLFLVDTPGFDDTFADDREILERIAKWLETSYRTHLLGGVIYLHDISNDRIMGSTRKNLDMFNRLCGEAALDKVVLGTTKSSRISPNEESKRLARLKEVHWKDMTDRGTRVFRLDGNHSSALDLVNTVLERFAETTVLEIQRELVFKRKINARKATDRLIDGREQVSKSDVSSNSPDIVIPVMGPTGVGKSTFINAVLGENVNRMVVGDTIESCTVDIATAEVDTSTLFRDFPWLENRHLILVDTPGFDDTYIDDSVILEKIAKWLGNSYRAKLVLGGVIYLHDISNNRFTGTAKKNLAVFNRLCGEGAFDKVVLGTTMASRISDTEADKRLAGLKESHWKDIIAKGAQVFQFNGDHSSASGLLNIVLQRYEEKEKTVLEIQHELVDKKRIIPETAAGKELRYTLQQVLDQQKQSAEPSGRAAQGDPEADADVLEKEQIEQIYKQLHKLEVPLLRRLLTILGF